MLEATEENEKRPRKGVSCAKGPIVDRYAYREEQSEQSPPLFFPSFLSSPVPSVNGQHSAPMAGPLVPLPNPVGSTLKRGETLKAGLPPGPNGQGKRTRRQGNEEEKRSRRSGAR